MPNVSTSLDLMVAREVLRLSGETRNDARRQLLHDEQTFWPDLPAALGSARRLRLRLRLPHMELDAPRALLDRTLGAPPKAVQSFGPGARGPVLGPRHSLRAGTLPHDG